MRWCAAGLVALAIVSQPILLHGDEDTERAVLGVVSGLLGGPQPGQQPTSPQALAQERERLVGLLQSGQYVTTRQGEPVDLVVLGVPLTQVEHVYTAKPVTYQDLQYEY
jgi:hypothetical protein